MADIWMIFFELDSEFREENMFILYQGFPRMQLVVKCVTQ